MEFLVATLAVIFLGIRGYQQHKANIVDKQILDQLPFIVFIANKDLKIIYKNEAARQFIPNKLKNIMSFNNYDIFFKNHYLNNLYLDKDHTRILKSYLFWQNERLYCVGMLNICQHKKSHKVANVMKLINNYIMLNENLQIDTKTILEYAGNLLNSEWVCFYRKVDNEWVKVTEYCKKSVNKVEYNNCDKIKYFEYASCEENYKIISRDQIKTKSIANAWDKAGITHKIVAPIRYEDEIYGIVSFSMYDISHINTLDSGMIQLVISIVNFVIGIQISIKRDLQTQENFKNIEKALVTYMQNQTRHSNEMYERELYQYKMMTRLGAKGGIK